MWGELDLAIMEEQFSKAEKLRQFSEELKLEQQEFKEAYAEAISEVEKCRVALHKFRKDFSKLKEDYKKVTAALMKEMETFKELKEVVELNKQIVELLQK